MKDNPLKYKTLPEHLVRLARTDPRSNAATARSLGITQMSVSLIRSNKRHRSLEWLPAEIDRCYNFLYPDRKPGLCRNCSSPLPADRHHAQIICSPACRTKMYKDRLKAKDPAGFAADARARQARARWKKREAKKAAARRTYRRKTEDGN